MKAIIIGERCMESVDIETPERDPRMPSGVAIPMGDGLYAVLHPDAVQEEMRK